MKKELLNDPDLKIEWPIEKLDGLKPKLSNKDLNAATIRTLKIWDLYFDKNPHN